MLSVSQQQARTALLHAFEMDGQSAVDLCTIDMRRMPLVVAGEDASQYIPFGLHPDMAKVPSLLVRRLRELMLQYMVEGVTVSAHTLPKHDAQTRSMMQALRSSQPNLPSHLLHHWCADQHGGRLFRRFLQDNWRKAWLLELDDSAPADARRQWLAAVNIFMLRLLREAIKQLPEEHADLLDMVLVQVLGASYHWLLREFTEHQLEEVDGAQRQLVLQVLAIQAPALAFFRQQPRGRIFSDAANMVAAYGLDAELLPRFRQFFSVSAQATARQALEELAADDLGDHLLKRSWARLSLRDMGEKTAQGMWMKLALDVKRLDKLLSSPDKAAIEFSDALQTIAEHPFAVWLLAHREQGMFSKNSADDAPWREDETSVQAFLLFEQDANLERARRLSESRWLNRETELIGDGRGSEAGRILCEAHAKGSIVLLQNDPQAALIIGTGARALQACLRVEWSEYLRIAERRCGSAMGKFLDTIFQPGIAQMLKNRDGVFFDAYSASGLLLRGNPNALLLTGVALREALFKWLQELDVVEQDAAGDEPVVSLCLAVAGEWSMPEKNTDKMNGKLTFSAGFAQAESAVSRNDGLQRLLRSVDEKTGRKPLGSVRVEGLKMADGKSVPILCNRGFVITGSALHALSQSGKQLCLRPFSVSAAQAGQQLPGYRLPGAKLEGMSAQLGDDAKVEHDLVLMVNIGKVLLAGSVEDVFEVLDGDNPAYTLISKALPDWQGNGRG